MPDSEPDVWEDALIADMRAHDGRPSAGPLRGHPLMVMTSTGAKSGLARRAILTYSRDGDDFIVAGTAGGSPTEPLWVENLRVHPQASLEIGDRTFAATARVTDGDERDRLWDQHVADLPWFGEYPSKTDRVIAVVRLTPKDGRPS
jgi:deazaflavin-dependent oxidoreductase (nitroreductase family)